MDNIAPDSIDNSFKDWEYPEILRLYRSSSASVNGGAYPRINGEYLS